MTRSERRSLLLHEQLAEHLSDDVLEEWTPRISANISRLEQGVRGEPHTRNLARWAALLAANDLSELRQVLTGRDRDSIEMREVSPMSGLLSEEERDAVRRAARHGLG